MTAKLYVSSTKGIQKVEARALLDTAATVSIISEDLARCAGLPLVRSETVITGYGSDKELGKMNYRTVMDLKTIHGGEYVTTFDALVDNRKLTVDIPMKKIDSSRWPHLKDILIADDQFGVPGPVDMIIGTGELPSILLPQIVQGPKGTPAIHMTKFGGVMFGMTKGVYTGAIHHTCTSRKGRNE